MGVKHAVNVTRAQAEAKYIELQMLSRQQKRRAKLEERMRGIEVYDLSMPYQVRDRLPELTSEDAREIAIAIDLASRESVMRREAMIALADLQEDASLEMELVRINDRVAGGEGFENYYITADGLNGI